MGASTRGAEDRHAGTEDQPRPVALAARSTLGGDDVHDPAAKPAGQHRGSHTTV
jgi:hypothetical protein